jgi:hypothetical protein
MGTGALSQSTLQRGVEGRVAADSSAYVKVDDTGSVNGHHVSTKNGQLVLDFGDLSGQGKGSGLNANSVNYFDGTFRIEVQDNDSTDDPEDYFYWITEHFGKNGRIDFYYDGAPSRSIVGPNHAFQPSQSNQTNTLVGVCIDLSGLNPSSGTTLNSLLGGGHFKIHVSDQDPAP